ncbi:hypothetical protein B0J14DRAFT_119961 [Halenospora varia]|nr:hypothetical protein B0J14DRAFT_119961 [Halenospora varia]
MMRAGAFHVDCCWCLRCVNNYDDGLLGKLLGQRGVFVIHLLDISTLSHAQHIPRMHGTFSVGILVFDLPVQAKAGYRVTAASLSSASLHRVAVTEWWTSPARGSPRAPRTPEREVWQPSLPSTLTLIPVEKRPAVSQITGPPSGQLDQHPPIIARYRALPCNSTRRSTPYNASLSQTKILPSCRQRGPHNSLASADRELEIFVPVRQRALFIDHRTSSLEFVCLYLPNGH